MATAFPPAKEEEEKKGNRHNRYKIAPSLRARYMYMDANVSHTDDNQRAQLAYSFNNLYLLRIGK